MCIIIFSNNNNTTSILGVGRFITGFESYPSLYSPKQGATKELPFDPKKIEGRTFVLFLSCGMSDAFEPLIAYLFGAFCIKCCGGVFYDPQDDICWDDLSEIERTIASDIEELIPAVKQGQLPTHEFEGWI